MRRRSPSCSTIVSTLYAAEVDGEELPAHPHRDAVRRFRALAVRAPGERPGRGDVGVPAAAAARAPAYPRPPSRSPAPRRPGVPGRDGDLSHRGGDRRAPARARAATRRDAIHGPARGVPGVSLQVYRTARPRDRHPNRRSEPAGVRGPPRLLRQPRRPSGRPQRCPDLPGLHRRGASDGGRGPGGMPTTPSPSW